MCHSGLKSCAIPSTSLTFFIFIFNGVDSLNRQHTIAQKFIDLHFKSKMFLFFLQQPNKNNNNRCKYQCFLAAERQQEKKKSIYSIPYIFFSYFSSSYFSLILSLLHSRLNRCFIEYYFFFCCCFFSFNVKFSVTEYLEYS